MRKQIQLFLFTHAFPAIYSLTFSFSSPIYSFQGFTAKETRVRYSVTASYKTTPNLRRFNNVYLNGQRNNFWMNYSSDVKEENLPEIDHSEATKSDEIHIPNSNKAGVLDVLLDVKTINAIVLILFATFLILKLVLVDSQSWRGWSAEEIALRIPISNWREYENGLFDSPVSTKTIINTVIYLAGDWLAQIQWGKKSLTQFDISQTLRNGLIAMFLGPVIHFYYQFSDSILPQGDAINGARKIVMDSSIFATVKTFVYLFLVGFLKGDPIISAGENAKQKLLPCLITGWKFWPLAHCLTYSVIPPRHRVLWVNMLDLFWSSILASMANPVSSTQKNNENVNPFLKKNITNLEQVEAPGKFSRVSFDADKTNIEINTGSKGYEV